MLDRCQIAGINNHVIYNLFRRVKHSNLFISKCSGLCLNFPLSVQAVRIRQGYCLSHCNFRSSAINTQQVLPCLLRYLTIVSTWRVEKHVNTTLGLFGFPHFSKTYPASAVHVLLSSHLFCYCQWDPEALRKCSANIFKALTKKLQCITVSSCLQTNTIVFALHKVLPLSEPLHADAQDYCWSLLCLELFIQLQVRQQANLFGVQHKALRHNSCRICLP